MDVPHECAAHPLKNRSTGGQSPLFNEYWLPGNKKGTRLLAPFYIFPNRAETG